MSTRMPLATFVRRALLLLLLAFPLLPASTARPQREHFTPEEIELIRNAQALDVRMNVFVKAAERRLLAITDPAATAKKSEKELAMWGEVKGTRAQLLSDVAGIFDEAITNIDDAALHSEKSPLVPKAMAVLGDAARRMAPQLKAMFEKSEDERERRALESALEELQEILEAAAKHPAPAKK